MNFNDVTVNDGARFAVNSNKTLSVVSNGRYFVSNNTNGQVLRYSDTFAASNSYVSQLYGSDPLFSNKVAGTDQDLYASNLRESYTQYIDKVDLPYWLSGDNQYTGIRYSAYANSDNSLSNNALKLTGKIDGKEYLENTIAKGPYAFLDDMNPESFTSSGGGVWSSDNTSSVPVSRFITSSPYMKNGDKVYNHPYCLESGKDVNGVEFKSSTLHDIDGMDSFVIGYVSNDTTIKEVKLSEWYPAGTVFVCNYFKFLDQIDDMSGFLGYSDNSIKTVIGFIKITEPFFVLMDVDQQNLYGVSNFTKEGDVIEGIPIIGEKKAIRKQFQINLSRIAFLRSSTTSSVATSNTFGNLPMSSAINGDVVKAVSKSSKTTISDEIDSSKIYTDLESAKESTYGNNTIKVPYGAKTLSVDSSALSTSNATHISALASSNNMKKYAVLSGIGDDITIDLSSIVNTQQTGSSATVSFYAEKVNISGYTDEISDTPVTVTIEVDRGVPQTITYNAGGGIGTVPGSETALSGSSYAMASGSGLTKDGNPFTSWTLSYTPLGETSSTSRVVGGGEAIVVPDTTSGKITATANFSGISATKTTESTSSVVTITWDTNAPVGLIAKFKDDATGDFDASRTKKFSKIKVAYEQVPVPTADDLTFDDSKEFDGWWTTKDDSGRKLSDSDVQVTSSVNTTYYAHWTDAGESYTVTYDARSNTTSGAFSNGETTITEKVKPGHKLQGPKINGKLVAPDYNQNVADGEYAFYGWYTDNDVLSDEAVLGKTDVSGDITYKAFYGPRSFLACNEDFVVSDPRKGKLYHALTERGFMTVAELKTAASNVESGSYNTAFINTEDECHFFTLLKSTDGSYVDPSSADSWAEFRIVHVGQHDSDGTGITFQAVHMLPKAYQMNSTATNEGGWASSELRTKMQAGGEIYNMFDSSFMDKVVDVPATSSGNSPKGKLWLPSYSELTGTSQQYVASDGSQFDYWNGKVTNPIDENDCLHITGSRSGNSVSLIELDNCWWLRTPNTQYLETFQFVSGSGFPSFYNDSNLLLGVVPCFSL